LLFRGEAVKKRISVLSGGERARLCLAGLLLSQYNILVLDEPGNHLDVDTVEALAEALLEYKGTIIFTSHDRHFMKRVATSIIEVRDGRVTHHGGNYDAYLDKVNKEIEAGERELATERAKLPSSVMRPASAPVQLAQRSEKEIRKEVKAVERTISQCDGQKRSLNTQLENATDSDEATRLEHELLSVSEQLAKAEERWSQLQEELEGCSEG
jgi:ATP-binding cassette subfamily F protein 3